MCVHWAHLWMIWYICMWIDYIFFGNWVHIISTLCVCIGQTTCVSRVHLCVILSLVGLIACWIVRFCDERKKRKVGICHFNSVGKRCRNMWNMLKSQRKSFPNAIRSLKICPKLEKVWTGVFFGGRRSESGLWERFSFKSPDFWRPFLREYGGQSVDLWTHADVRRVQNRTY